MSEKTYRDVEVAGTLHTQFGDYFLLSNYPVEKDSWQSDNQTRFVVTPREAMINAEHTVTYYPAARHIVLTPPWCIEYAAAPCTIKVKVAEFDLSKIEVHEDGDIGNEDALIQAKFELEV